MVERASFKKFGICRRVEEDGDFFEGMYQNDELNGFGRQVSSKDEFIYYVGMWKDDKYDGYGKCVFADNSYFEGTWRKGRQHG